ncbi:MAG: NFYB/HAP3 family transcription factor subunit [Candidatus Aenigmarchaeota archaeon]|nr:NFYB/HAP3 family transcription factor subunit [Candidatus Aenigmarchaeota archaeon]
MSMLTIEPIRRLFKKAGAKRVSDEAAKELAKVLEEKAFLISKEAQKLSEISNRRTILKKDIKMARRVNERS